MKTNTDVFLQKMSGPHCWHTGGVPFIPHLVINEIRTNKCYSASNLLIFIWIFHKILPQSVYFLLIPRGTKTKEMLLPQIGGDFKLLLSMGISRHRNKHNNEKPKLLV